MRQLRRMPHEAVRRDRSRFALIEASTIVFSLLAIGGLILIQWSWVPLLGVPIIGIAFGLVLEIVKKRARAYHELVPEFVDYMERYRQLHPRPEPKTFREAMTELARDIATYLKLSKPVARPAYIAFIAMFFGSIGVTLGIESLAQASPSDFAEASINDYWDWETYAFTLPFVALGSIGWVWHIYKAQHKLKVLAMVFTGILVNALLVYFFAVAWMLYPVLSDTPIDTPIMLATSIYIVAWLIAYLLNMIAFSVPHRWLEGKDKRKRDELDHSRLADDAPHTDALEASPQTLGHSQLEMSK